MDDITIAGDASQLLSVVSDLAASLSLLGLSFKASKCSILGSTPASRTLASSLRYPHTSGSVSLLGSVVGPDLQAHKAKFSSVVTKACDLLDKLQHPLLPCQHAFAILRHTPSMLTYHMRVISPQVTFPLAQQFDVALRHALCLKLGLPEPLSPEVISQMHLPLRAGGLGLRASAPAAPAAYIASIAAAARRLGRVPEGSILRALTEAYSLLPPGATPRIPPGPELLVSHFLPLEVDSSKLQQTISVHQERLQHDLLLSTASPESRARLLSCSVRNASLWLSTPPSQPDYMLPGHSFSLAVRLRLGLPAADVLPVTCACGQPTSSSHFMACRLIRRRTVTHRHDSILHHLVRLAASIGVRIHAEPPESRLMVGAHERRPDLRSYSFNALADVSVTHPCSPSLLDTSLRQLGAASARELSKHRKFDPVARHERVPFFAFVLESFGAVGPDAILFLSRLASAGAYPPPGLVGMSRVLPMFLRSIAFTLQRGNAAIMAEGSHMLGLANSGRGR